MKVICNIVGFNERLSLEWPKDFPIPNPDSQIEYKGHSMFVREVVWYPAGDSQNETPFVYIVMGPTKVQNARKSAFMTNLLGEGYDTPSL